MEGYLIYIGKSALAAGAFYLVFLALFQNRKQFVFNRIYLPVSLALSFIIPLITFTTIEYIEPASPVINGYSFLPETIQPVETPQPQIHLEWYHYLFGIYIMGTVVFLFHLLFGHYKAIRIIKKSRIRELFNTHVNITEKDVHPFSFFNKIVLSEKTLTHPNLEMIIAHERIHVNEKHTMDILFTEILFILQWFNPFAWLIKDAVKNNLEYKVDAHIAKTANVKVYQLAMVTLADKKGVAPFLTALNGSQLKNRIIMMKRSAYNKYAHLKQLAVLPLLAILVMGLANREVRTEVIPDQKEKTSLHSRPQEETTTTGKEIFLKKQKPSVYIYPKQLQTMKELSKEKAVKKYGNKAKHGAIEITTTKKALSEENQELNKFLISIENQNNQLILQGLEGCAFKELKFTINENKPVTINHLGMTTAREKNSSHDLGFLFEIEKTKDQINLTGKAGTAWKKLSYKPLNIKHFITETGVSRTNNPLIVIDGIVSGFKTIDHINPADIQSVTIMKDEKAAERYGEKGRDGVIEIIMKPVRIYTELQLKKYIAKEIRYPLLAQKSNLEKTVNLSVKIDGEGIIDVISDQSSATDFTFDEVVVVSYKNQDTVVTGYPSKNAAEESHKVKEQLFEDETKRVINKISKLDIEKFKGKTIGIKMKFMLQ